LKLPLIRRATEPHNTLTKALEPLKRLLSLAIASHLLPNFAFFTFNAVGITMHSQITLVSHDIRSAGRLLFDIGMWLGVGSGYLFTELIKQQSLA